MCDPSPGRPSFRAIFTNWNEYDAPVAVKLGLTFRNAWLRLRHGQTCCGNDGQPGC